MAEVFRYRSQGGFYSNPIENYGYIAESTFDQRPKIIKGYWPRIILKDSKAVGWEQIEDHRKRESLPEKIKIYGKEFPQEATKFWLPEDRHNSPAREMIEIGALPEGALLERPEKLDEELKLERKEVILADLDRLDAKSARPMRAILADTATVDDKKVLAEMEEEARKLREELGGLVLSASLDS